MTASYLFVCEKEKGIYDLKINVINLQLNFDFFTFKLMNKFGIN